MEIHQDTDSDEAKEVTPVTFFGFDSDPVKTDKDFRPGVFNPDLELSQPVIVETEKLEIHDPHELPASRKRNPLVNRTLEGSPKTEE